MQATKIKLNFTAPLHIFASGVGFEQTNWMVHSDTLYSALFTVWSYLEDITDIVSATEPPFILSSAFPYYGEMEFYPRPHIALKQVINVGDAFKKLAKVRFVESTLFNRIIAGETIDYQNTTTMQNGLFWLEGQGPEKDFIFEAEIPRVIIDRLTNKTQNYFVAEINFEPKSGLFFWVRFLKPEIKDRFLQALRLLGDEGLGLDRTSGKGLFWVENENIVESQLPGLTDTNRFMTLSLYHPAKEEITENFIAKSGYGLTSRGGYVFGRSYRRQALTMFTEGSVFGANPTNVFGKKQMVLDEKFSTSALGHPVYRYGYAFPVGIYEEANHA